MRPLRAEGPSPGEDLAELERELARGSARTSLRNTAIFDAWLLAGTANDHGRKPTFALAAYATVSKEMHTSMNTSRSVAGSAPSRGGLTRPRTYVTALLSAGAYDLLCNAALRRSRRRCLRSLGSAGNGRWMLELVLT